MTTLQDPSTVRTGPQIGGGDLTSRRRTTRDRAGAAERAPAVAAQWKPTAAEVIHAELLGSGRLRSGGRDER